MRLVVVLSFGILFFASAAHGQGEGPLPDFTVISLVGDSFTVAKKGDDVRREGRRGLRVPLADPVIDGAALVAVKKALEARDPALHVVLALIREPAVYAAQSQILGLTGDAQALVDALEPVFKRVHARKVLLVSKIRHETQIQFADFTVDYPGMLEGLGFFLDPARHLMETATQETEYGYVALFAYFRLDVIDLATLRVVAEERVIAAPALRDSHKGPWESMTAEQKVSVMKQIVAKQIDAAVPRLLDQMR